ncbi:MAG: HipA domain-containing protein [Acidobacteriaceae bacterium]
MHSLSGLIHVDHRTPSLDYDLLLSVTMRLTRDVEEVEKMFRLACFNVLAHNRDDHAKNFSFLLNARSKWVFAPAYDLVFSYRPGSEQSTLVMGEGKNPGVEELLRLGKQHRIKNAASIVDSVQTAVKRWKSLADEAGVPVKSRNQIAARLAL